MTQHSKGPLTVNTYNGGHCMVNIFDEEENRIAICHGPIEEAEANAILFAAAPDLLDVAKMEDAMDLPYEEGMLALMAYGFDYMNRFEYPALKFVQDKRRAAIAKAEGR